MSRSISLSNSAYCVADRRRRSAPAVLGLACLAALACSPPARAVTSTWVNAANGQSFSVDLSGDGVPDFSWVWPSNDNWSQQYVGGDHPYGNNQHYYYTAQPSNWSTLLYPTNGNGGVNYDVVFNNLLANPCNLDVTATVDSLTLAAGTVLNFIDNHTLTIANGSVANAGSIVIDSNNGGYPTIFNFSANASLTGSGSITLYRQNTAQITTAAGVTLTQASSHTIQGQGILSAALVNNGMVDANATDAWMEVGTNDKTNAGTLRASSGGRMNINGVTITNTGGTILAQGSASPATDAYVQLTGGARVIGGTFTSNAGSAFYVVGSARLTTPTISSGTIFNVQDNTTLTLDGATAANAGTFVVDYNNGGYPTVVLVGSNLSLSGGGDVFLNREGVAQLNTSPTFTLTNVDNTLHGQGIINASLVNNKTVAADVSGAALDLSTSNMTNNDTFKAVGGGSLHINSITVSQASGAQVLADGSAVELHNATISGGKLNSPNGGAFYALDATDTLNAVTNNALINVHDDTTLSISGGSLVNNGSIVVDYNNGGYPSVISFASNTDLSGSGSITLNRQSVASLATAAGATVTQAASHIIQGQGVLSAAMVNHGLVDANVTGNRIDLVTNDKSNDATIRASAGGYLNISGITLTNTGGTLLAQGSDGAAADAYILLTGGTHVIAGTLTSNSGSVFYVIGSAELTTPTLLAGTMVNVQDNTTLTLDGATAVNHGTFLVDYNYGGFTTSILIGSNLTLSGGGDILLNRQGTARLNTSAGVTLTNVDNTLHGQGQINAALVNHATVAADVTGTVLDLQTNNKSNDATFKATNGGTLNIAGIAVDNTGGLILADNGAVTLNGSTAISKGTLTSTNGGYFLANGNASLTNLTLSTGTSFQVQNQFTVTLLGPTITNNGIITVNSNNAGYATNLLANSDLALNGTGQIYLVREGATSQLSTGVIPSTTTPYTLTQAASHTIHGNGYFNADLDNYGSVLADSGGTLLLRDQDKTNRNLFKATNSSTMELNAITVTQTAAGQIMADNGWVRLDSATISGGTLNSTNGGYFYTAGDATLSGALINNALVQIHDNTTITVDTPALVNNGTVLVDFNNGGYATLLNFAQSSTLSGTGDVLLNRSGGPAQLTTSPGAVLTVAANQTIHGQGQVRAALTNAGTISSDAGGTIDLMTNPKTNTGIIKTTGASAINIAGIALNNTGGTVLAQGAAGPSNDGVVYLNSSTNITGGTLTSTFEGQFFVNGNATLTNVTISPGTVMNTADNLTLSLAGSTLTNNGAITMDATNGGYATRLTATVPMTLNGSGSIILNRTGTAFLSAAAGASITNSSTQTIRGAGIINAPFTNHGTVLSDLGGDLALTTSAMVNDGLIGVSSGSLSLSAPTLNNTNGILRADASPFYVSGTEVTGGTLASLNNGAFYASADAAFRDLTLSAPVNIPDNNTVHLSGAITNNSAITVDYNNGGYATYLRLDANTTLSGSGSVLLNRWGSANLTGAAGTTLTNALSHTIHGTGTLSVATVNNGTVAADVPGSPFSITGAFTNHGVLKSSNGGYFLISGSPFYNDGTVDVSAGNNEITNATDVVSGVLIRGSWIVHSPASLTVNGGTINTIGANASVTLDGPSANFPQLTGNLSTVTGSLTLTNGKIAVTPGNLANAGTITVGPSSTLGVTGSLTNPGVVDLSASGSVLVLDYPSGGTSPLAGVLAMIQSNHIRSAAVTVDPKHILGFGTMESSLLSAAQRLALTGLGSLDDSALIVRPAYLGDANLNGKIDPDDYALIDRSYARHLTTNAHWWEGDFNYSGGVDAADYLLIDKSMILQSGPFAPALLAQREARFGPAYVTELLSSVPEPGVLLAFGAVPLLLRRRAGARR